MQTKIAVNWGVLTSDMLSTPEHSTSFFQARQESSFNVEFTVPTCAPEILEALRNHTDVHVSGTKEVRDAVEKILLSLYAARKTIEPDNKTWTFTDTLIRFLNHILFYTPAPDSMVPVFRDGDQSGVLLREMYFQWKVVSTP